jgi:hypothetical protein
VGLCVTKATVLEIRRGAVSGYADKRFGIS